MSRRSVLARAAGVALLVLAIAPPSLAWEKPPAQWSGTGVQRAVYGEVETWSMQLSISRDSVRVDYPSLGCSAVWRREGARYRERITSGDCIDGGLVTLVEQEGKLFVNWTVRGETPDIAAAAVLFPAGPIS